MQRHFNELSIAGYLKLNVLERQELTEIKIYNSILGSEEKKGDKERERDTKYRTSEHYY